MDIVAHIDSFFKITERGSNFRTEIRGGIVTFLAMAYVLVVMPNTLEPAGMGREQIFTATVIATIVGTGIMALYARFPIAQAPAMGTNAFFTYTIVLGMGYTWQEALAAVFLSGVLFILITISGLREIIVNSIPKDLRLAIAAGLGAFLLFIGLQGAGIIVGNSSTLVTLGDMSDKAVLVALFGIILTTSLYVRKFKTAIFIGIVVTTIIAMALGITAIPSDVLSMPEAPYWGAFYDGLKSVNFDIVFIIVILSFLMVNLFDTTGTIMAVSKEAGAMDENGKIRDGSKMFLSDAVGTMTGAAIGVSTVSSYAESTIGIESGARTGFSALVVCLLFFIALFFSPIFTVVTSTSTVAALFIVAVIMMGSLKYINWEDPASAVTVVTTIMMMILTYSITDGLGFGVIMYSVCKLLGGKWREVSPIMYVLSLIFFAYFVTTAVTF